MEKDNVFTYEPKMKANLELIMDIMRCDCDYVVYKDEKIKVLEKALELACRYGCFDIDSLLREAKEMMKSE